MEQYRNIAVFAGSLRKDSFNRKVAETLIEAAPKTLKMEIIGIGDIPLYNEDLETGTPPPQWTALRERIRKADGVLFVTPEYNRSVPAMLKNVLDVTSRPYGKNVWNGKPGGIVSVTPGGLGAFGANHHLRQSCVFLNILLLQQPEAYISGAGALFDADGKMTNDGTRSFLAAFMKSYASWVEKLLAV
ncbi:MAG: NAD(P)H-dependent oxidoreductase [Spirochaetaceae bacterium]|nr:NAD(P)H-dependent oxidoreductase [Spirochaetaceae bacterium]